MAAEKGSWVKFPHNPVAVIGELLSICHWTTSGKAITAKIHKSEDLPDS